MKYAVVSNGTQVSKNYNYPVKFVGAGHPRETQSGLQSHQQESQHAAEVYSPKHRGSPLVHELYEGKAFEPERAMQTLSRKGTIIEHHQDLEGTTGDAHDVGSQ